MAVRRGATADALSGWLPATHTRGGLTRVLKTHGSR